MPSFILSESISISLIFCNAGKYLFNLQDPPETVKVAAQSIMRDIIEETQTDSLLIVSHNPSISGMISYLSGSQVYNFPTCVFACFSLDKKNIDKDVKTEYIIRPKDGKIISLI